MVRPGSLQIQFSLFIDVFSDSVPLENPARILLLVCRSCTTVTASRLLFWQRGQELRAQHKTNPESTSVAGGIISSSAPPKKSVLLLDMSTGGRIGPGVIRKQYCSCLLSCPLLRVDF